MKRNRYEFLSIDRLNLNYAVFAVLIYVNIINSQTQLQCTIGGAGTEVAWSVVQSADEGYVLAGTTNSFGAGDDDIYIVKINLNGIIQWSRTIGGMKNEGCTSIIKTSDGGYAIAGSTETYGTESYYDFFILKLENNGMLQWCKTIGGSMFDEAISIIQTADGGFAAAGSTTSFGAAGYDMFIVKLDINGGFQWCRKIDSGGNDAANSIIEMPDGGFEIAGVFSGQFSIIKLDTSGNLMWDKIMDGTGYGSSLITTIDGGSAAAGYTYSYGAGNADMYVVKLDTGGIIQWSKTFGGPAEDKGASIIQSADGGYAISGLTNSFGMESYDVFLVKLNSNGALLWDRIIGGAGAEYGWSVIQTTDGGYAVCGETLSYGQNDDMYFVKLDLNGNTCSNIVPRIINEGVGGGASSKNLEIRSPSPVISSPTPVIGTGGNITSVCLTGNQGLSNNLPSSFRLSQNYPNPFNPSTQIEFSIPAIPNRSGANNIVKLIVYNMLGQEISTLVNQKLNAGTYKIIFNGDNLPSGIYFYSIITEGFNETKRMVLLK